MNAKNPSHGRFAFVFFALLALGSAACGGNPDDELAHPEDYASAPPAEGTSDEPSRVDGGAAAQPESVASPAEPTGDGYPIQPNPGAPAGHAAPLAR